jgi:hypothetical protein
MHKDRNRWLGTSVVFLLFLAVSIGALRRAEAADAWVLTNSMTIGRVGHTATQLADGRVLVNGGDNPPARAEIYDPTLGTWSLTGPPSTARFGHTSTRLADGRVLITGGAVGDWSNDTTGETDLLVIGLLIEKYARTVQFAEACAACCQGLSTAARRRTLAEAAVGAHGVLRHLVKKQHDDGSEQADADGAMHRSQV